MTAPRAAAIVRWVHGRLNDNPPEGGRSVGDVRFLKGHRYAAAACGRP